MSTVRERHRPVAFGLDPDICEACVNPWPCDAIQQADEALMWKQTAQRIGDALTDQRDAARADADRLLGIARQVVHYADVTADTVRAGEDLQSVMEAWRETVDYCSAALRQHEEATR